MYVYVCRYMPSVMCTNLYYARYKSSAQVPNPVTQMSQHFRHIKDIFWQTKQILILTLQKVISLQKICSLCNRLFLYASSYFSLENHVRISLVEVYKEEV
uniref:Uncharacterized protein n=1 Tax=Cacopsylla melanoneura TaxID=428564 RepID=A0A8D8Z6N5_9HEMI